MNKSKRKNKKNKEENVYGEGTRQMRKRRTT